MREPQFDGLRSYADNALRQPEFAGIQQRARRVRRRRAVASSAAVVAAVLVATGFGYAAVAGADRGVPVAVPTPTAGDDGWPRMTDVVATGPKDFYGVYERCRDCAAELYASPDAGVTWQRRAVPPAPDDAGLPRTPSIVAVGPGVLAWQDARVLRLEDLQSASPTAPAAGASPTTPAAGDRSPKANDRLWITVDGGRTWRRAAVDSKPVAAVPPGTRPVDCSLVGQSAPCRIYAVNPVNGRFAPLADQPSGITFEAGWTGQANVPIGARLWVSGLDPATRKPALATSSDGGRTWHTHVFTDGVPAVADHGLIATMYLPTVAAGTNGTAYAMTYRKDLKLNPYRTTDGGTTWRAGAAVPEAPDAGFVTADGAHVIKTGQQFLASRDGGRYERVTLPGYPADLRQLTQVTSQQAAGRYLVFSLSRVFISDDGWTWRQVDLP
jgi:hypothetical protein